MTGRDFTTFYLSTTIDLPVLLEPHKFYVSEARKRLLAQFSDIEREASEAEARHLEASGQNFDPDRDDPADAYEHAYQEGVSRWIALNEMHNTVTLALTAGMFHQFDKTLRDKAVREFSHWLDREKIGPVVWNLGFPRLIELLEWLGMDIIGKDFFDKLDACRLVVNVYKHGDGDAHCELSSKHPEYYDRGVTRDLPWLRANHEELTVSEAQFVEFAEAITAFWTNIPQYSYASQLREEPTWLEAEYKKHGKRLQKVNSTVPAPGGQAK
ncbi:hypothetical protein [Paraburkholderia sacchari]|uniref:Uncharacterized protein n=1 Tax=Paraburkholderia sacchari TaxID=159450 RepID=A0A8T6ZL77_9BURK|nr:hypothetical protein [Paraburkholderia sacchari]NLP65536.1 hypothetical protein [Paraburkholderia sacchari]